MKNSQTRINSIQKHILDLNQHLNCKAARAFEARQALGTKGTSLLNNLFEASCDYYTTNNVAGLISSLSAFIKFLCDNVTKAANLTNCMAASRSRILTRLNKLSNEMASLN